MLRLSAVLAVSDRTDSGRRSVDLNVLPCAQGSNASCYWPVGAGHLCARSSLPMTPGVSAGWKAWHLLGNFEGIFNNLEMVRGGEGGIRPLGTRKSTTVFETVPIDRSGTSPSGTRLILRSCRTRQHVPPFGRGARSALPIGDRCPPYCLAHSRS